MAREWVDLPDRQYRAATHAYIIRYTKSHMFILCSPRLHISAGNNATGNSFYQLFLVSDLFSKVDSRYWLGALSNCAAGVKCLSPPAHLAVCQIQPDCWREEIVIIKKTNSQNDRVKFNVCGLSTSSLSSCSSHFPSLIFHPIAVVCWLIPPPLRWWHLCIFFCFLGGNATTLSNTSSNISNAFRLEGVCSRLSCFFHHFRLFIWCFAVTEMHLRIAENGERDAFVSLWQPFHRSMRRAVC